MKLKNILSAVILSVALFSCGNDSATDETLEDDDGTTAKTIEQQKILA